MSAMLSGARRWHDGVEMIIVAIYIILTAYLVACNAPPRVALALRDAVAPIPLKARARNAGAERSAAAWRPSHIESRARRYYF
jgi:hypothetical protein